MDMGNYIFQIIAIILVHLKMIKQKDMDVYTILMAITIKDNGKMIVLMDMANIFQLQEGNMKVNG
jgi:hypothetical protein